MSKLDNHENIDLLNIDAEKDTRSDDDKESNDIANISQDSKPKSAIRKTKTCKSPKNRKKTKERKKSQKRKQRDPNKPIKHVKFLDKVDIVKIESWKKYNLEQTADENLDELFEDNSPKQKNSSQVKTNDKNNNNNNNAMKKKKMKNPNASCACMII